MNVLISAAFRHFIQPSNLETGDFSKRVYMLDNMNKHLTDGRDKISIDSEINRKNE